MRMNKALGQANQQRLQQQQQQQHHQVLRYQHLTMHQSLKDLKKIIKILKKNVIKSKITRKMNIVV